ncbi:type II toxin-antitoxin system RelE/ParE family toxin [Caulobacter sp. FWC2]|uniref:type II toxin-antitoxin system RelE/ParE family toxin n=1 Tax=Caulobacter sp. FWC2 TaxID=69664 RepID=UPI000C15A962|nr:type II toxin-antitoxin system RelE/ParE family toxin [Caulobacter sp. FWC2]PIB93610.1 plasmid stabilization protein ParE [Caulobacter sp. FWC2]
MKRYELTPLARFDMREIWAYTVQQWGRRRADRYIRDLTATIDTIARDPYRGVATEWIEENCRKQIFRSHVIFYVPTHEGVVVARILHQQMDASSRLV